eukprot:COSAG01_NODE_1938_length_8848_cov_17.798377_8_plen_132_part_00
MAGGDRRRAYIYGQVLTGSARGDGVDAAAGAPAAAAWAAAGEPGRGQLDMASYAAAAEKAGLRLDEMEQRVQLLLEGGGGGGDGGGGLGSADVTSRAATAACSEVWRLCFQHLVTLCAAVLTGIRRCDACS